MCMKLALLLSLFLLTTPTIASKFQFNFNVGQDTADDGEDRSGTASLVRFGLSTSPASMFRWNTAFTYQTGSNAFSQGDFTLGPYIYPLAYMGRKTPGQPFIYAEGKIGFGTLAKKSRTDTGFGMGAGIDLQMFKHSGVTFSVEQHSASEASTRLWLGFYWR
ncbi:MAG: hypothetical protein BM556_10760 [Bacteriovorax sp. MedPE-SWde]|nr:MAG: hypothetical protein BM556_10760 [Bacteriovorax sp. MedPE-SWde]